MLERSLTARALSWLGALSISGVAVLSQGCTSWQVVMPQDIPRTQTTWERSRVSYSNGSVVELRQARVQYPMLRGEIVELEDPEIPDPLPLVDVRVPTAIDLRRVNKIELMQPDPRLSGLLATGIVIGGAGIVTGFVFLGLLFSGGGFSIPVY